MKVEDLARGGLVVLGVAAGALLGFAAGMAYARDPQVLRRTAARYLRGAAQGLEQATLMAAQAREHVADLWAEAREEALAEVDAADFERRAAAAGAAVPPAATARPAAKRPRKPAAAAEVAAPAAKKAARRTRKAAGAAPAADAGPASPAEAA